MDKLAEQKTAIFSKVQKNDQWFKENASMNTSFDVGVRKLLILDREVHVYYVTGLCDSSFIIEITKVLVQINDNEVERAKLKDIVENRLIHQQVKPLKTLDDGMVSVLSGLLFVLIDGEEVGFEVDVRTYPGRSPEEADTEKVIRGARDGYTENIIINTALTRRRIRDGRFRFEIMKVGERSKLDVAIGYINGVADPGLVKLIKDELEAIDVDGLPMADKSIEEFLVKQGINPFPMVRYTERPDTAAAHVLEGHVIIITDTSPSVIITPTTLFHHVQHAEEYRQAPSVGTFIRWIRFLGILASLFLLPLWLLFVLEPDLLPAKLQFIGPNEATNIPTVIQIFLADLGVEFLRMAAIHTPTPLATAMGLIAAALIGQIAIDVGLFVPEVILYVAIASIGSFSTPSYELAVANKMLRLFLLIFVAAFHTPGFLIATTCIILYMARLKSLNTPYLWPFLPFNPQALWQILIRTPVPGANPRPSIVHPQDKDRQPAKP
ncbi:spore germination protein [Priestia megaterium]|uniref:spore germination protein n=1 Tax=Priestia megaterium TaxID=1404 RepID=UPI00203B95F0|nr:spore germination protein [Priestia megaterium]MCM3097329.1 spore germination protein [Priestia megaterium]MED4026978.1 spore germination protein [Priestia megaterium]